MKTCEVIFPAILYAVKKKIFTEVQIFKQNSILLTKILQI